MSITNYRNDLMFKLNKKFITDIFDRLIIKFESAIKASQFLKIPYSTFRSCKNGYFNSLPEHLIKKILESEVVSQKQINENTISNYYRHEENQKILNSGRIIRNTQLKKWKKDIPNLKEILSNNLLNFEKWFDRYYKLINFGVRKFNYIKKYEDFIEISYITHSNKKKKEFTLKFPKKIILDQDFIYFFGLWVGDKAGGKRFGIVNTEKNLISFTKFYLRKLLQTHEVFLYIAKNQSLPKDINYDKLFRINQKERGYSYSIHSANGILTSFFNYLEGNLNNILYSVKNFNIFFAGLFDAEGNVFLEDSCFRWASKDEKSIKIFKEHLKRLSLFDRFDGVNLVTYNKEEFSDKILPYLKHHKKINNSNLVIYNKGKLEPRFLNILNKIKNKEGITNNELAKTLKKKKVYAQVTFLEKLGYIFSKNYPKQLFINKFKSIQ